MRGKVVHKWDFIQHQGITPAYAGKSLCANFFVLLSQDHPRVCGEKHLCDKFLEAFLGSPPRMRGKEASYYRDLDAYGITPAYAGKSKSSAHGFHKEWDHPRVCGEKAPHGGSRLHHLGSPPRMRGKD